MDIHHESIYLLCVDITGARVDSIDFWSARVRDLEQRISLARQAALEHAPTTSYFVFFNNQKDAAIAAQTNLHAEDGHSFRVMEAPGPEEVGAQQGGTALSAVSCMHYTAHSQSCQ